MSANQRESIEERLHDTIESLLSEWKPALGRDYDAYRNHVYRVYHLTIALIETDKEQREQIAIAAAFHDVGIWLDDTFDYLDPSARRARDHLSSRGCEKWSDTVTEMIDQHHRIRPWANSPLVDAFRKADWLDVCLYCLPTAIDRQHMASVLTEFPRAGFHYRLVQFTLAWTRKHPSRPLPMLRL